MGARAELYRRRRLAERTGAEHELELYGSEWPTRPPGARPCYCEWSHLQDRLLGKPSRPGHACACIGPVGTDIPGYPDDEERMKCFAQGQSLRRVTGVLSPIVDWYRAAIYAYTSVEFSGVDMDAVRAELVQRLGQLSPDDAECLIAELS